VQIRARKLKEKAEAKEAEQARRAAELARAKALKDAEWQEQKAAMEAKKREEEALAAIQAKKLEEEQMRQEAANRERLELQEKQRKLAAMEKEAQLEAKQKELRAKQEAYIHEQIRANEERKKIMEEKEAMRIAVRAEKKRSLPCS
jgi:colicin import membrane protein